MELNRPGYIAPLTQTDGVRKMSHKSPPCPECGPVGEPVDRRRFLKTASAAAIAASTLPHWAQSAEKAVVAQEPESIVKLLYESLSPGQKEKMCHSWDYQDGERGLLRTRVANNWQINDINISSDFYSADQQQMIRDIFEGIIQPEWHKRIDKQLEDDAGGYGEDQSVAIFGNPGDGKFEFVMTGRHMTLRCDGNSADHVAFGGPIFYGHAANGFNEGPAHEGNVFWPQAVEANKLFTMLDGKQRDVALVKSLPKENQVAFRGTAGGFPGIPVSDLASDQREQVQQVLSKLIEPYRHSDRDEVIACLKSQGGLDACSLAFYSDGDIGQDSVWDCWRLEGPSFVWYFRGAPHVHVWVNVASDPSVPLNA